MCAFAFFLSYSHEDADDKKLGSFASDLSDAVRSNVGSTFDNVGFVDRTSIGLGAYWNSDLATALDTCQVFVPLYSRWYFERSFCGREWHAYRTRTEQLPIAQRGGLIIPVLWGLPSFYIKNLPSVAADVQFTHADLGDLYAERGLHELYRLRKGERDYVVSRLAERIATVALERRLTPLNRSLDLSREPEDFPAPSAAATAAPAPATVGGGPRFVQFVFVAGTRTELTGIRQSVAYYDDADPRSWKPFAPGFEDEVEYLAQLHTVKSGYRYEVATVDNTLMTRLRQSAQANKIVVLIVDTWTLKVVNYRALMEAFDASRFINCVVLLPFNDQDSENQKNRADLERTVRQVFSTNVISRDPGFYTDLITSTTELSNVLPVALNAAKVRILDLGELKKPIADAQPAPVLSNV